MEIREFTDADWQQVWPIVRDVIPGPGRLAHHVLRVLSPTRL
ncbi:MAG TPA: hypothetical protein VF506_07825 [Streptosporangiaceae bacterium]